MHDHETSWVRGPWNTCTVLPLLRTSEEGKKREEQVGSKAVATQASSDLSIYIVEDTLASWPSEVEKEVVNGHDATAGPK